MVAKTTPLGQFTKKRNWGKYKVKGALQLIHNMRNEGIISLDEDEYLRNVEWRLKYVVDRWDETTPKARRRHGV